MLTAKEFLKVYTDERGDLFQLPNVRGTQFISSTKPGVTRGNHYHLIKTEWFMVLRGQALLVTRGRYTDVKEIYRLHGKYPAVVSISPHVVHSIENVGEDELILLVQSSEIFDPANPDTYSEKV